uniref:Secreted protein n=1 Tax=Trichogramma kaykai TaxID=54128 RepID=A0ABD2XDP0_9HYME
MCNESLAGCCIIWCCVQHPLRVSSGRLLYPPSGLIVIFAAEAAERPASWFGIFIRTSRGKECTHGTYLPEAAAREQSVCLVQTRARVFTAYKRVRINSLACAPQFNNLTSYRLCVCCAALGNDVANTAAVAARIYTHIHKVTWLIVLMQSCNIFAY